MRNFKIYIIVVAAILISASCSKDDSKDTILTIFHVNDVHGQIKNMAKIKQIVEEQKKKNPTILVSAGDMFSGNPVVDNYKNPGYPMIDIMNQTGFNIATIGNHEFDFGDSILAQRLIQSKFPWINANTDLSKTQIKDVTPFKTITINGIKITFIGLIETGGMQGAVISSTHPLDIKNVTFQKAQNILSTYKNIKETENSQLYIALSHLGHTNRMEGMIGDFQLASQFPYFDAIIGSHTHYEIDTTINNIPIVQAGSYLHNLGKIEFRIRKNSTELVSAQLIDLDNYIEFDSTVSKSIDQYYTEMNPILGEVIGYSSAKHTREEVGCLFTHALQKVMKADLCIQNTGGIRSDLTEGPITIKKVYEIDPFNNGTVMYKMPVGKIIKFLKESNSGFFYSGLSISQVGNEILISDNSNKPLHDTDTIKVGMNDYAATVHHTFFPNHGKTFRETSSDMLIEYIRSEKNPINFLGCKQHFEYEKH